MRAALFSLLCAAAIAALCVQPHPAVSDGDTKQAPADLASKLPERVLAYAELKNLDALPAKLEALPSWRDAKIPAEAWEQMVGMLKKQVEDTRQRDSDAPIPAWAAIVEAAKACKTLRAALIDVKLRRQQVQFVAELDMATTDGVAKAISGPMAKMFKGTVDLGGGQTAHQLPVERDTNLLVHVAPTRLTVSMDVRSLKLALADKPAARSLAARKDFAAMRGRYGSKPLWLYANAEACFDLLEDSLSRGDAMDYDRFDGVMDFRGLRAVAAGSDFESTLGGAPFEATALLDEGHEFYALLRSAAADPTMLQFVRPSGTIFALNLALTDAQAKWRKIMGFAQQIEKSFGEDDFSRAMKEMKNVIGMSIEDAAPAFGPGGLFTVFTKKTSREGGLIGGQVKDPAKLKAFVAGLKANMLKPFVDNKTLVEREYKGFTLMHPKQEKGRRFSRSQVWAYNDQFLLWSDHVDSVTGAIDVQASGKSMAANPHLAAAIKGGNKVVVLDPATLAGMEREFLFLESMAHPDAKWFLSSVEGDTELRVRSNLSAFSLIAGPALSMFRYEATREAVSDHLGNLRQITSQLRSYQRANKKYPKTLAEIDGLEAQLAGGHKLSDYVYRHVPGDGQYWGMIAWAKDTKHGHLIGYAYGSSSRVAGQRFRSGLGRLEQEIQQRKERIEAMKKAAKENEKADDDKKQEGPVRPPK